MALSRIGLILRPALRISLLRSSVVSCVRLSSSADNDESRKLVFERLAALEEHKRPDGELGEVQHGLLVASVQRSLLQLAKVWGGYLVTGRDSKTLQFHFFSSEAEKSAFVDERSGTEVKHIYDANDCLTGGDIASGLLTQRANLSEGSTVSLYLDQQQVLRPEHIDGFGLQHMSVMLVSALLEGAKRPPAAFAAMVSILCNKDNICTRGSSEEERFIPVFISGAHREAELFSLRHDTHNKYLAEQDPEEWGGMSVSFSRFVEALRDNPPPNAVGFEVDVVGQEWQPFLGRTELEEKMKRFHVKEETKAE